MKNFLFTFVVPLLVLFLSQCENNSSNLKDKKLLKSSESDVYLPEINFSKGFSLEKDSVWTILKFRNPSNPEEIIASYYLIRQGEPRPSDVSKSKVLEIPVQKISCLSAPEIEALKLLNVENALVGISSSKYVSDSLIIDKVKKKKIAELSVNGIVDKEKLIECMPNVLMISWFQGTDLNEFQSTGICVLPNLDYLETHPLGRAEWLKLYGVLFEKEIESEKLFSSIQEKYQNLKKAIDSVVFKPKVISGKMLSGTWYVPGGKSYLANIIGDSGAEYVWSNNSDSGSIPLDIESVLYKGKDADYWIIVAEIPDDKVYNVLQNESPLYTEFDAFKEQKILFCNTINGQFFEKSPFEPHLVLADFIHAFHSELLKGYSPKFYKIIKQNYN
ncbi:MAG: ABC transporter substrate-binding protein [Bacteroidales bacterium]